ncbi:graves disease carrier protein-like protein [Euroglyphus maynei]|uniref:Graves disease carrier protein-like protein n=1 Tax=Euroglyphus maynei TaxID=6958 RepID=A0A1Y3AMS7_EURMA|nr:graves disease carrier protein-like protein [Euroglyphus maynei]
MVFGNGAQMVRIFPYAAVQFMSFEAYKRVLSQMFTGDELNISLSANIPNNHRSNVNHELKFIAGSMAGVTSVLMTYPLDLVRARLATIVNTKRDPSISINKVSSPTTILGTLVSVFRNEGGILGLYRGITPTVLAMIPYGGCNFYMFERLKHGCVNYAPSWTCYRATNDKLVLNVPSKLLCGGIAGAIGQTAIYPLDVARRRMQLAMTSQETAIYSESFVQTLVLTYRSHGVIRGLYRGMSVNYIRAVPMVAVSFCTYELLKQLFGLETGV